MTDDLDWHEVAALKAFEQRRIVHLRDLPTYIGISTMGKLIAKGLVEPVDRTIPLYSKDFAWQLTHATTED